MEVLTNNTSHICYIEIVSGVLKSLHGKCYSSNSCYLPFFDLYYFFSVGYKMHIVNFLSKFPLVCFTMQALTLVGNFVVLLHVF